MPGVAASSIRILTLVAGILVAIAGSRSAASIAHHGTAAGTPCFREQPHDVRSHLADPAAPADREFPDAGLDEQSDPDESDEFDRSHPGCSTFPPFQFGRGTWSELARPRDLRGGANHVRGPPAAV